MKIPTLISGVNDFVDDVLTHQMQKLMCDIMLKKISNGTEPKVESLFREILQLCDGQESGAVIYALGEALHAAYAELQRCRRSN